MSNEIRNFAPSWPAAVMGTAILPIALNLSSSLLPWMHEAAIAFFFLSLALLVVITLVMAIRLVLNPKGYLQDYLHPVAGAFLPTLPIAFIIVALDLLVLGPGLLGEAASTTAAFWLFGLGAAGIWLLGLALGIRFFENEEIKLGMATFGWFIPPVSQLIITVGGLELVKHLERGAVADLVVLLALAGLGIGTLLFLFMGAAIFHRYVFAGLPPPRMSPTIAIGMAPTAVLVVALAKLAAAQSFTGLPIGFPGLGALAAFLGIALWGYSAFWFLLALLMLIRGWKAMKPHFGLPWWAMTFPLGALAVATGSLGQLLGTALLEPVLAGLTVLLLLVWTAVAFGTIRGAGNLSIFVRE